MSKWFASQIVPVRQKYGPAIVFGLVIVGLLGCSSTPSLQDVDQRMYRIETKVAELDELGLESDKTPSCETPMEPIEREVERLRPRLTLAMFKMEIEPTPENRQFAYDLLGDFLDLINRSESLMLECTKANVVGP